jgi:hypothetical protein
MAEVELFDTGGDGPDLPDVCMRCGAPATVRLPTVFAWSPPWTYLLLLLGLLPFFVALVLARRMTVRAPLCARHKNPWWRRQLVGGVVGLAVSNLLVMVGGVVGLAISILLVIATKATENVRPQDRALVLLGVVYYVASFAWCVLRFLLLRAGIHARRITFTNVRDEADDDAEPRTLGSITLAGVARAFAEAYYREAPKISDEFGRRARARWQSREADDRYRAEDPESRLRRNGAVREREGE